jgi:hypothetical protein
VNIEGDSTLFNTEHASRGEVLLSRACVLHRLCRFVGYVDILCSGLAPNSELNEHSTLGLWMLRCSNVPCSYDQHPGNMDHQDPRVACLGNTQICSLLLENSKTSSPHPTETAPCRAGFGFRVNDWLHLIVLYCASVARRVLNRQSEV